MNDDKKQKDKDEFVSFTETEIDNMFDKPLSKDEENAIVVQEVSDLVAEMTEMNNISSDIIEDTAEAIGQLKASEGEVDDLKKILALREDLNKTA